MRDDVQAVEEVVDGFLIFTKSTEQLLNPNPGTGTIGFKVVTLVGVIEV